MDTETLIETLQRELQDARSEVHALKAMWSKAQNACADHARRADALSDAIESKDSHIRTLAVEISTLMSNDERVALEQERDTLKAELEKSKLSAQSTYHAQLGVNRDLVETRDKWVSDWLKEKERADKAESRALDAEAKVKQLREALAAIHREALCRVDIACAHPGMDFIDIANAAKAALSLPPPNALAGDGKNLKAEKCCGSTLVSKTEGPGSTPGSADFCLALAVEALEKAESALRLCPYSLGKDNEQINKDLHEAVMAVHGSLSRIRTRGKGGEAAQSKAQP